MTDEYIKREDAINTAYELYEETDFIKAEELSAFIKSIPAPAEDVVPVVRCSECIFYEVADYGDEYTKNVCRLFNRQIQSDDYCSYGMRENNGGE